MQHLISDTGFPDKKVKEFFILFLIVTFGIILFNQLMFMMSAFFGSVTLYILLKRPHKYLTGVRNWKSWLATIFLMLCSIILFGAPLYFIVRFVLIKISPYISSPEPIVNSINTINLYIKERFDFTLLSPENLNGIKQVATKIIPKIIGSGLINLTNFIILYFLLWFMLQNGEKMEKWIKLNSPFNKKNTLTVMTEVNKTITNNSIGIVILGLIQGIAAIIGYYLFGVDEPILWGLITGAASVIPFAGTMAVWVPMAVLLFATDHIMPGVGLTLWGLFVIGGIDNVLRFLLQKRMAQTPEIITVLGVIVGLNLFGFWGLIFGPLMITLFILFSNIYKKEFMNQTEEEEDFVKPASADKKPT